MGDVSCDVGVSNLVKDEVDSLFSGEIPPSFIIACRMNWSLLFRILWPWPSSAATARFASYLSRTWIFLSKYQPTMASITGQACPKYVADVTWKIVSSVYPKAS